MPYPPKHSIESPEDYLKTVLKNPQLAAKQAAADDLLIAAFHDRKLNIDKLREALDAGANPSRIIWKGYPALHLAVMRRSTAAVELLLQHGAQPNDVDQRGMTALKEAHDIHFTSGARLISEYGGEYSEPVFESNYQTLIDEETVSIIKRQDTAQLKSAILLGADVNAPILPPLLVAMYKCDEVITDILMQAGADADMRHQKYGGVLDQLWLAQRDMLATPHWLRFYDKMAAAAPSHAGQLPNPNTMTIPDLLKPMASGKSGARTYIHFLIDEGKIDFVMNVIRRDKTHQLTSQDFLRKSQSFTTCSLIEAIANKGYLKEIMSPDVWQGRIDDMLSLEKHIPLTHRQKFDFNKAAAPVRAEHIRQRRDKAKKAGFYNKPKFPGR